MKTINLQLRLRPIFIFLILTLIITTQIHGQINCCRAVLKADAQTRCITVMGCNGVSCTYSLFAAAYGNNDDDWFLLACIDGGGANGTCSSSSCNELLPVEMSDFQLNYTDQGIQLYWVTATETNNKGFEIQKSADAKNWLELDFIEGQGQSIVDTRYEYLDASPMPGFNYYRLKQIDFDQQSEYTSIKVAVWQGSRDQVSLVVLPNPSSNWITVAMPVQIKLEEAIQFEIYDQVGRLTKTISRKENEEIQISISDLPKGYYFLKARQEKFQTTSRFYKN